MSSSMFEVCVLNRIPLGVVSLLCLRQGQIYLWKFVDRQALFDCGIGAGFFSYVSVRNYLNRGQKKEFCASQSILLLASSNLLPIVPVGKVLLIGKYLNVE